MKPGQKALGIPDPTDYGDITSLPIDQELPWVIQEHRARKAGRHLDVRMGPDRMFSWATRKEMPEPGQKIKLFQTPLHEGSYASYEGPLTGYGAGTVRTYEKGSVFVTSVNPGKISFVTGHGRHPQRYTMIRDPRKPTDWLLINTTPKGMKELFGRDIPAGARAEEALGLKKEKYRSVNAENIDKLYDPKATFSEKLDGAAALYKLMKDRVEVVSYRTSKTGRPIIHTERLRLPRRMEIPSHLQGSILRGEIWGERMPGASQKVAMVMLNVRSEPVSRDDVFDLMEKTAQEAIPPQELGGILNASLAEALRKQRERRIRLRNAIFNIRVYGKQPVGKDVPYTKRVEMIQEALKYLPADQFHMPQMARTVAEQRKLWQDIKAGRNPRTREGVVIMPEIGTPTKVKIMPEHDVFISGFFDGQGKYKGNGVGGFMYSLKPNGPPVGRVGTGFNDELRRDMHAHPEEYVGRTARIRSQGQFESGAYRAPALIALHEDYPMAKTAALLLAKYHNQVERRINNDSRISDGPKVCRG